MKGNASMHLLIQFRRRTAVCIIGLGLACFAVLPATQAVSPTPDGLYSGANLAEGGSGALSSLTTGSNNTAIGSQALFTLTDGVKNTAVGAQALKDSNGDLNTAVGFQALVKSGLNASENTATGYRALFSNVAGADNTAIGSQTLYNTNADNNTAVGRRALINNTSGFNNIALGSGAGSQLTFGANNIDIGNSGVAGEGDTIRIGGASQSATFIAGISGAAVMGPAVHVNADGQLGTAPSSQRFKEAIKPMNKESEAILALKPVTFHYKKEIDHDRIPQFGLVAEEVEKVNSALITRDRDGKPYTVRYEAVNAMLLNEFLKARRQIDAQQKQIDALTAAVQKVSAQLEVSKPATQTALNNQ